MATKKKKKAIEFQIGWPGLIAIIASTFCVLAWTFVLGFWMGQKLMGGQLTSNPQVTALNGGSLEKGASSGPGGSGLSSRELSTSPPSAEQRRDDAALKALRAQLHNSQSSRQGGGLADLPTEVVGPEDGKLAPADSKAASSMAAEMKSQLSAPAHPPAGEKSSSVPPVPRSSVKPAEKKVPAAASVKEQAKKKPAVSSKRPSPSKVSQERIKRAEKKSVVLQIASYKDPSRAEKEAKRWQAKGFKTRVKKVNLGRKGTWYRVYIGSYGSVEEAKKAAAQLAVREGITCYVVPNP